MEAIVALTDKRGNQTITYPDGSTLLEEKQPDPQFGQLLPFTKRRVLPLQAVSSQGFPALGL